MELAEVVELLSSDGDHFLASFSQNEQTYAGSGFRRTERLAGRFAAKEAVLKALGIGLDDGIEWPDIEIHRLESGAPVVELHGRVAQVAAAMAVSKWLITLTHTPNIAIAVAIAIGEK